MKIPRLAQSYDQRDRGDWARSCCPHLPLAYDIAHIGSILKISLVHKPSQCVNWARYLEEVGALFIVTYTPAVSKCGDNRIG